MFDIIPHPISIVVPGLPEKGKLFFCEHGPRFISKELFDFFWWYIRHFYL